MNTPTPLSTRDAALQRDIASHSAQCLRSKAALYIDAPTIQLRLLNSAARLQGKAEAMQMIIDIKFQSRATTTCADCARPINLYHGAHIHSANGLICEECE